MLLRYNFDDSGGDFHILDYEHKEEPFLFLCTRFLCASNGGCLDFGVGSCHGAEGVGEGLQLQDCKEMAPKTSKTFKKASAGV